MRGFSSGIIPSAIILAVTVLFTLAAQAQTFNVIHNFTGRADGAYPVGLTMDKAGNLYGTTAEGGQPSDNCIYPSGCGTVFRLAMKGSGWIFTPLYIFLGGTDGDSPAGRVIIGPNGSLYGSTYYGGNPNCTCDYGCSKWGCGTVFNVRPPVHASPNVSGGWAETVLYPFNFTDGLNPTGDLVFDNAGNIYGTTQFGGTGSGNVYELSPAGSGWTEKNVFLFSCGSSGGRPEGGVIFDEAGNLYGPALVSGNGCNDPGLIFQLVPSGQSWVEQVLYDFTGRADGAGPWGGLIFDQFGSLYGSTLAGGSGSGGTVFELMPSGGNWNFTVLWGFVGSADCGPGASLTMDSGGNLYGGTSCDGAYAKGSIFKLSPTHGGWNYTSLHDFSGASDGAGPSNVVLDGNGNLYGTARSGGAYGYGVAWEITP